MISVGIVGCGGHAVTHAEAIRDSGFAKAVACADIDTARAKAFAEAHGIPNWFGSLAEMVAQVKLDLLIIVAFPSVHPQLVSEAIAGGIRHILCEKPLAMSSAQAEEIQAIASRSGALVVEGLMYRSHPQMAKAKELVDAGAIGEVRYIYGRFSDYANPNPGNWRNNRSLGGGSMTAKGCYLVDACNWFAGARAKAAFCYETTNPEFQVEVGETGTIIYDNGVTAQFETNHRSSWREEIAIVGTRGTLRIPHAIVTKTEERKIVLETDGAYEVRPMRVETFRFAPQNSYLLQLKNLYACIREGAEPNVPLHQSVANYKVTDALLKSAQTGRLEPVQWE